MKRWLSYMLLFGALLGLLGQETAFASAPAIPMANTTSASSAMGEECAEMMGAGKSQPDQPCKGLTLDCIAKMGCAIPLAIVTRDILPPPAEYRPAPATPAPSVRMAGQSVGPEPKPPLTLG